MTLSASTPKSVLMVCLGNICRSPIAEEVMRQRTAITGIEMKVDSAGTGDWHIGKHPDPRAQKYAKEYGYNISKLVARQFDKQDLYDFDLILAMDAQNLKDIENIKASLPKPESDSLANIALLSEVDPCHCQQDVPDPYYSEDEAFDEVIERVESSVTAWLGRWKH